MSCEIGHARGQSLGSSAVGDWATHNEVSISGWYSGSWTHVFRPKKRSWAKKIAQAMRNACGNNYIGYSQPNRNSAWREASRHLVNGAWTPDCISAINTNCDTDCSALVHLCCQCAGIYIPKDSGNSMTTHDWSEPRLLPNSGAFYTITSSNYTRNSAYLRAGDILRSAGHTAIVVTDGDKAYEKDEFQQENDIENEAAPVNPKTKEATGKKAATRELVIVESKPNPVSNEDHLKAFKYEYLTTFGMTFSWQKYNDIANNRAELINDYARLMIDYIIIKNGKVTDNCFNEWATARLVKMLNSGYNMLDAAALERVLRLYPDLAHNTASGQLDPKGYVKAYYFNIKDNTYARTGTAQQNDQEAFYKAYNEIYYKKKNNITCPKELTKAWNENISSSRQPYFADVILEQDGHYTIGEMDENTIIPSAMKFSDFDKGLFSGQLMSLLFSQFIKDHPELLLWKKTNAINYYSYTDTADNKKGQLQQDWAEMVGSQQIPGKEDKIDILDFTKYKKFALNATVNKLAEIDSTVYLQDDILCVESKVQSDQIESLKQWDEIVDFSFFSDDYEYYPDSHWAYIVDEAPYNLLFWLEFLDTDGELSKYSIPQIGPRQVAKNDSMVRTITYESVPNVLFIYNTNSKNLQEKIDRLNAYNGPSTGYTYIYLPDRYKALFSISAQGKTAKDAIDELLYNNTHVMEQMNITTLPIYYLEPNKRIYICDDILGLDDDYILNKISIPLTYNGTMSLQVSKAVNRLY